VPAVAQPLTLTIKPFNPPALGLPQTSQDNEADQEHEAAITLTAVLAGPLPPDLPTILLTDRPIEPSPLTGGVWNLPYVPPSPDTKPEFEIEPAPKNAVSADSSVLPAAPALVQGTMPTPTLTFDAMDFNTNGAGHPPDTNGDVGLNHYMEAVNTSIGIYTKTTGAKATAYTFNSFWSGAGTGTACDTSNQGDPIVLYDTIGQRWIFMDFAWDNLQDGPYYFCFGVSQTSNPLGNYWRYAIRGDDAAHPWLPDYPKGGVWPDGLYFSANMFDCLNSSCSSATREDARAYAFNLQKMEAGQSLTANDVQAKDTSTSYFTLMPSNVRGTLPPANTPNYFVGEDLSIYAWDVFKFHVDFTNPLSSTFTGPTQVSQANYVTAASSVPEPSPGNNTDTLADRMMFLNQYRKIGGAESVWVQHTTGTALASTPTGIQWAQINVTGGTINTTPVQQQIFNNGADGLNRFMGSLAVDKYGNAALGYNASSSLVAPDIRYMGRLVTDTLSQMPQAETTLLPGVTRSVQTGTCGPSACTRWGDYSAMTVDPVDDCTFWYANMYFPVQGGNWVTRIGSFKFPSCIAGVVLSNTTTSVASSVNPAVFGQTVKFTATVALSGPGVGTPTGSVTFTIDGSTAGTAALISGKATFATSSLSVGSHPITATYRGDANFNGSAGKLTPNQTVNKASTTTAVASSVNPSVFGQTVKFTATVAISGTGAGTPTGMVTFTVNGSTAGTAALIGGKATFATSSLSVGSHPVTMTYSGDANFKSSAGKLTPSQTVNKASTTTAVASSQNPVKVGRVVTFTATVAAVAPGVGIPTGVVSFTIDGSTVGTAVLIGGVAKFPTSSLSVGLHPVTATYRSDANFTASVGALIPDQTVLHMIYLPLVLKNF
jgi:hypothetical protein